MILSLFKNHKTDFSKIYSILVLSSFGPYIFPSYGLRTEHFFIYTLLPLAIISSLIFRYRITFNREVFFIFMLLIFVTLETLIVTFFGHKQYYSLGKLISYIENYIQPISIIFITTIFIKFESPVAIIKVLNDVIKLFIILLFFNSLLIIGSVFFDLSGIINYFVLPTPTRGISVSELAATMGRFSGVFDQPVTSGLSYSLGLLLWAYQNANRKVSLKDITVLTFLFMGGLLSISKVFILGGITLFIFYLIKLKGFKSILNFRLLSFFFISYNLINLIFLDWSGLNFFMRLFKINHNTKIIDLFTGGRFGSEETYVKSMFLDVWSASPFLGKGFASVLTLDNAYAEFFVQGGLIALLGYIFILSIILLVSIQDFNKMSKENYLLFFMLILILGGGFGAPILTINRFSTVCWVILLLLFQTLNFRKYSKVPRT